MKDEIDRRAFLEAAAGGAAGAAGAWLAAAPALLRGAEEARAVRIGLIGAGGRGKGLLDTLLAIGGIEVPAICDIDRGRLEAAREAVEKSGRKRPEGYSAGTEDYRRLVAPVECPDFTRGKWRSRKPAFAVEG